MDRDEGSDSVFYDLWRRMSVFSNFYTVRLFQFFYLGRVGVYQCVYQRSGGIRKVSLWGIWKENAADHYLCDSLCTGAVLSAAVSVGQKHKCGLHLPASAGIVVYASRIRDVAVRGETLSVLRVIRQKCHLIFLMGASIE